MDSNRLRYFLAVNETGSIRKASELLRLSPAALSKSMKIFEEEIGIQLFASEGRGITVTDAGRELAQFGKPLVDDLELLAKSIKEKTRQNLRSPSLVKIGTFEVFSTHVFGKFLDQIPDDAEIILHELIPGPLEKALQSREIDCGITYIPIPTSGIEHQKVANLEMGIYGLSKFMEKTFDELPFAVPIQPLVGSPNKVQGLDGWPEDVVVRQIKYRVTMMESALELCRLGKAVCYLPTFVADAHNDSVKTKFQLTRLKPPANLKKQQQEIYIVKRKSDPETAIYKKIAVAIRELCRR